MRGSIRKRGSSWQLAVYVGYERGRSRYSYESVTGSRRDAERRLTQLMADVESGRLGHTSLATTSIYAHARRVRDKAAADAIGRALPG
jgi:hypothetical protein